MKMPNRTGSLSFTSASTTNQYELPPRVPPALLIGQQYGTPAPAARKCYLPKNSSSLLTMMNISV